MSLPQAMVSLDLWLPPQMEVDTWGLTTPGQLGPAARWEQLLVRQTGRQMFRFGWFLPWQTAEQAPPLRDHWRVFKSREGVEAFRLTKQQREMVRDRLWDSTEGR